MPLHFLKSPMLRKGSHTPDTNTPAPAPEAALLTTPEELPSTDHSPSPPPPPPPPFDEARSPASFSLHTVESSVIIASSTNAALSLIESGNWVAATQLVRYQPEEACKWASVKSRSSRNLLKNTTSNSSEPARRLPLHHACLKLRNCPNKKSAAVLIAALLDAYPAATQERETKHGCLPIHLAAFAVSSSSVTRQTTTNTSYEDEEISLSIIQNLLKVYPKACRETSEGGRLPLHMACAGRASSSVVRELLKHYGTDATRHRTKDGYLPLHLVALHGCSSEDVAILLLRKYPDAAVGRNKFDRIPLEEALYAAGENGRPKQEELVQVLRKHPSYWISSSSSRPAPLQLRAASEGDAVVQPITAIGLQSLPQHFASSVQLHHDERISTMANNNVTASLSLQSSNGSTVESSELTSLIKACEWEACKARCRKRPNEAVERFTVQSRAGAPMRCTPLHYVLESSPPLEVVQAIVNAASTTTKKNKDAILKEKMKPGDAIPLHVACTWGVSCDIIFYLLQIYPDSSKKKDSGGNLPLHQACYSGASWQVVEVLARVWPDGTTVKNGSGSTPTDIVERLHHPNRDSVISILKKWKEKTEYKGGGVEV